MDKDAGFSLNRRRFATTLMTAAGAAAVAPVPAQAEGPKTVAPESVPFPASAVTFHRHPVEAKIKAFAPSEVVLLDGVFRDSAQANLRYLHELDADRLLHNFRVNASLASSAEPLGGWEKPDCELRGHFVGHFLSACVLAQAAEPDAEIKRKSDYLITELAKCQAQLSKSTRGYLSAFPISYFDRLDKRTKV